MKIVINTQYMENYGSHDWNGEGECPQYWKFKGGSTYVIHNVTMAQAMSAEYWDKVRDAIVYKDDYSEEYILSDDLVDDQDFKIENYCDDWEIPKEWNANNIEV